MRTSTFIILIVISAVLLDLFYWAVIRNRWTQIRIEVQGYLEKKFHVKFKPPPPRRPPEKLNLRKLFPVIEITLILAFALWVGREYLNFDESVWPTGFEFGTAVRTNYYWVTFQECGLCVLWDGSIKGGAPALVDLHGSWLHPLVAISTLVAGFVNGTKVMLLGTLFLAGLAQWWMAKQFGTGWISRLYAAAMAVVGGNMAATMDLGTTGILLSHVSACLALAGGIRFTQHPSRRNAVFLGILLALLLVSGQAYLQAGFFLSFFPALFILFCGNRWKTIRTFTNLLLACGLMILLSGIFLVPLFHFLPQIGKWAEPAFGSAQSIQFIPLNLVINDYEFYQNETLGKLPYIGFYSIYIGWIPILLACAAIGFWRKENSRIYLFFCFAFAFVLLASSGTTFRLLALFSDRAHFFRFPSMISGFLIPLILGLAAIGLDRLLKIGAFQFRIQLPHILRSKNFNINLLCLFMFVPLLFSIRSAYLYGHRWFSTVNYVEEKHSIYEKMALTGTEWVSIPMATHGWVIPILENHLKLADSFRTWWWVNREDPSPHLVLNEDHSITIKSGSAYAMLISNGKKIPCTAHANGGYINVHCPPSSGGILTVMENYWPGWKAWVDGKPAGLDENQQWLTLETDPGEHDYLFRYLPLDVLLGSILTLVGIGIAAYAFFKK